MHANRHEWVPRRPVAAERGVHINFITGAEVKDQTFLLTTRGRSDATTIKGLPATPAGAQLTQSLLCQLYINGGTWTSSETLQRNVYFSRAFLSLLDDRHGIVDLADEALSPGVVWDLVIESSDRGTAQRNLRTFLARTFPEVREDGTQFSDYLLARTLIVDTSNVEGYVPEVSGEIERLAKRRVGKWFVRHRHAVQRALGGALPRDWLKIDAHVLIENEEGNVCPPQFEVGRDDLAAAMVLLALTDNKGPNLATIQSYTADSVERANDETAFVTGIKARNREVLRTPAPAGGLFSYGGLLEFVTAATRVERHTRHRGHEFDSLLFVRTGKTKVMDKPQISAWWKQVTKTHTGKVRLPKTLDFRRLRKAALLRGKHKHFQVIGQKPSTTRMYLADAVPDVILIPGLIDTQTP